MSSEEKQPLYPIRCATGTRVTGNGAESKGQRKMKRDYKNCFRTGPERRARTQVHVDLECSKPLTMDVYYGFLLRVDSVSVKYYCLNSILNST